jgi:hypothetical protein
MTPALGVEHLAHPADQRLRTERLANSPAWVGTNLDAASLPRGG